MYQRLGSWGWRNFPPPPIRNTLSSSQMNVYHISKHKKLCGDQKRPHLLQIEGVMRGWKHIDYETGGWIKGLIVGDEETFFPLHQPFSVFPLDQCIFYLQTQEVVWRWVWAKTLMNWRLEGWWLTKHWLLGEYSNQRLGSMGGRNFSTPLLFCPLGWMYISSPNTRKFLESRKGSVYYKLKEGVGVRKASMLRRGDASKAW